MVLNLIFLGAPGAGKGSVAQKISSEYNIVQISTGDLFRAKTAEYSDEGRAIKEKLSKGELIDDATTVAILKERLIKDDVNNGFILDGFPRTIPQAEELDKLLSEINKKLSVVIDIGVSEEEVVKRICNRLTCPECKKIYNKVSEGMIPKVEGKCDIDGAELVQREDDKEEVVRERYKTYLAKTAPLIEYYKEKGNLASYDGSPPVEESTRRAKEIIDKYNN